MKRKNFAFTLIEITMVIIVIGIIAAVSIISGFRLEDAKLKKLATQSQQFYTTAQMAYEQIASSNTKTGNITSLKDANGDGRVDSADLKKYFLKYFDGMETSCNDIKVINEIFKNNYLNSNVQCFTTPSDLTIGVEYDKNCDLSAEVREYLIPNEPSTRSVDNACARMVYASEKGRGIVGVDVFLIAFGKRTVK